MSTFFANLFFIIIEGLPLLILLILIVWLFIKVCKFVFKDLFRHA